MKEINHFSKSKKYSTHLFPKRLIWEKSPEKKETQSQKNQQDEELRKVVKEQIETGAIEKAKQLDLINNLITTDPKKAEKWLKANQEVFDFFYRNRLVSDDRFKRVKEDPNVFRAADWCLNYDRVYETLRAHIQENADGSMKYHVIPGFQEGDEMYYITPAEAYDLTTIEDQTHAFEITLKRFKVIELIVRLHDDPDMALTVEKAKEFRNITDPNEAIKALQEYEETAREIKANAVLSKILK